MALFAVVGLPGSRSEEIRPIVAIKVPLQAEPFPIERVRLLDSTLKVQPYSVTPLRCAVRLVD